MEELYPDVVAVVGARHTVGEAGLVILQALFLDRIDIEGGIGHDEVELPGAFVDVVVVGVAFADIPLQAVDGEIHLRQPHGVSGLLLPEAGEFIAGTVVVLFNKGGALHKHAARATGGVKHLAVVGFDDLGNQPHQRAGGEEFTTTLPFSTGKLGKEVFVDAAKDIRADIEADVGEVLEQAGEDVVVEAGVGFGQGILDRLVLRLQRLHCIVDRLAKIFPLWPFEQAGEERTRRNVHRPFGLNGGLEVAAATATTGGLFIRHPPFRQLVAVFSIAQEDQPQYRAGVLL